eukprot:scaffold46658_cov48-Phaeocystis_antarctica.AAC.1
MTIPNVVPQRPRSDGTCVVDIPNPNPNPNQLWANDSVGKNKGGDTTTRTGIESAGSGKDLGFWLWPLGAGRCKAAPYASSGPHPSPAHLLNNEPHNEG